MVGSDQYSMPGEYGGATSSKDCIGVISLNGCYDGLEVFKHNA